MDERNVALVMTVCSLMGHECNPEEVELRYKQAAKKVAAYHEQQLLLQSQRRGGLGFRSNEEE